MIIVRLLHAVACTDFYCVFRAFDHNGTFCLFVEVYRYPLFHAAVLAVVPDVDVFL